MRVRGFKSRHDAVFFLTLLAPSTLVISFYVLLIKVLSEYSAPAFQAFGPRLITGAEWDPSRPAYGLLPAILGTIATSAVAIVIALPVAVCVTVFLNEFCPKVMARVLSSVINVMAGMPSIVYGLWGAMVLPDFLKNYVMLPLSRYLGFIPLFSCTPVSGWTLFTAGVLLAVMIVPYVASLTIEAYAQVPAGVREALLSIGARPHLVCRELLKLIAPAVVGAALLGLGRAAGETIAVSLVVGNVNYIPYCLFLPGETVSALIANNFPEASSYPLMINALYAAGVALLALGFVLNVAGLVLMGRWRRLVGNV